MTEKTLTTENIKPALDALRGELAPWPVVAKKQDRLNAAQLNAANSGITSSLVAQIIANTAAIRALESAITGTGLRALVVSSLPAVGTQGILYIVPVTTYDPATDADVVNYSNEYIWIVAPDAPVTEGYYEQVGQTGIVINNGQLTITVNGTSVGTFTANQSGDTTAAITVPTNADYVDLSTSQTVTGGKTWTGEQSFTLPIVGSITGTASKAIADEDGTSIKTGYGKLAGSQTWTGNNTFSSIKSTGAVRVEKSSGDTEFEIVNGEVDATTNTLSRQDDIRFYDKNTKITGGLRLTYTTDTGTKIELYARSWKADGTASYNRSLTIYTNGQTGEYYTTLETNFLPKTTSVYSLGSSTYQWSSVYAQTYYYNGTQWGLDQNNTWTGTNTFQTTDVYYSAVEPRYVFKNLGLEKGVQPSWHGTATCYWYDKNSAELGFIRFVLYNNSTQTYEIGLQNKATNGDLSPTGSTISTSFKLELFKTGDSQLTVGANALVPAINNSYDLGTSTNKWKTLNGINPGALSLPDASIAVSIGTTDVRMDGTYTYLPVAVNGWLYVALKDTTCKTDGELTFYIGDSGTSSAYAKWATNFVCSTDGYVRCFIPVLANSRIRIRVNPNGGSPTGLTMTIYPCQGNV